MASLGALRAPPAAARGLTASPGKRQLSVAALAPPRGGRGRGGAPRTTVGARAASPPAQLGRRAHLALAGAAALLPLLPPPARAAVGGYQASPSTGVEYCDDKVGGGAEPFEGDVVKVNYTGRLASGAVFDSAK
mmetsp:Transcript_8475/g.27705  ORF Transcript_8475/g.27705 Transcript_8475/m.27705 type:complete len:134 (+) Transcript_8475:89-490(+)